jgi:hypothetical protein
MVRAQRTATAGDRHLPGADRAMRWRRCGWARTTRSSPWDGEEVRLASPAIIREATLRRLLVETPGCTSRPSPTNDLTAQPPLLPGAASRVPARPALRRPAGTDPPDLDPSRRSTTPTATCWETRLREVAATLRKSVRETDLAPATAARSSPCSRQDPPGRRARCRSGCGRTWARSRQPDGALRVTASLGVGGFPGRASSSDRLLHRRRGALPRQAPGREPDLLTSRPSPGRRAPALPAVAGLDLGSA